MLEDDLMVEDSMDIHADVSGLSTLAAAAEEGLGWR